MPAWDEVLDEIRALEGSNQNPVQAAQLIRQKYLTQLHAHTGRNIILYYSGWLVSQAQGPAAPLALEDGDMTGFMTVVHQLDRSKGLDLVLHTPGGNIAAAEALGRYLREIFGTDMRALVPHLAMSAGTMIACACERIVMGRQSSLGPIDPQFGGVSVDAVIEEFDRAVQECTKDPARIPLWQTIISKYHPTFLGQCSKAQIWSREVVSEWLSTGMFASSQDPVAAAKSTVEKMADNSLHRSHERHLGIDACLGAGLTIERLEEDPTLQELLLTVHHAASIHLANSNGFKLIENHLGRCYSVNGVLE
jgi:ATP-dependent protease ClpP protease subunit